MLKIFKWIKYPFEMGLKNFSEAKTSQHKSAHDLFNHAKKLLIIFCFSICSANLLNSTTIIAMEKPESSNEGSGKYGDLNFNKVNTISEIYNLITEIKSLQNKEAPRILVAFDWDNTISMIDACELPLREENTKEVIEKIALNLNADIFVLTSRLGGKSADTAGKDAVNIAKRMHKALPVITQKTPLKGIGDFQIHGTNNHVLYSDGIVFAGSPDDDISCSTSGSCKGRALAQLIDGVNIQVGETEYKKVDLGEFDALIFVDNDKGHLDAVQEAFAERSDKDKIHLIYYKQSPKLGSEYWSMCENLK